MHFVLTTLVLDRVAELALRKKKMYISWFGQERVSFANWQRHKGQRSWRSCVSWTV